nr:NUDIX hydrolase 1 [Tanacetum cinerariifolium]
MFPSDFKLKRVGASHIENGATSRMPEVAITDFIVKDNKILLGHRRSALVAGNSYNLPGGHLEHGESFEEGITREVKEETGLDITNIEVLTTANHILSDVHAVATYMRTSLSDPNQTPQNIEPEKCEGWD